MADSDNLKKSFWNFKKYEESQWFNTLVVLLVSLGILYLVLHLLTTLFSPDAGYEYVKLDKDQVQQINRIYFDTLFFKKETNTSNKADDTLKNQQTNDSAITADSIKIKDSIRFKLNAAAADTNTLDSFFCSDATSAGKVLCYLWNEFNHKLEPSQMITVGDYLKNATSIQATNFLSNERFQVKSYFWLTGPLVYLEIIFWAWFGVICSLLFNMGVISKNRTTDPTDPNTYFDSSEIPFQIAKLLYAPACTLVIVLGYNYFNDQNLVDISSSKGVVVFAYIGGFYSSRLIAFLDRLKEILLPASNTSDMAGKPAPLKNVVVQVELGEPEANFWTSLKNDLNSLQVTLQEENSTQQAIALNINQNQWPLFIIDFVKPGSYTAQAKWATKDGDRDINFKATKDFEMAEADVYVTLILMKS